MSVIQLLERNIIFKIAMQQNFKQTVKEYSPLRMKNCRRVLTNLTWKSDALNVII